MRRPPRSRHVLTHSFPTPLASYTAPPFAASARVLEMAQQVEFRRVDARPDPEHAEDGGEQVVVAGRLACNVPHAIQIEPLLACEAGREPHHHRHLRLLA